MRFTTRKSKPIKEIIFSLSLATTPLVFNSAWAEDGQQTATQVFAIPAQPLNEAIDAFIQATDWQVGFITEQIRGIQSHAVEGRFSKEQALNKLLEDTGIEYRFIESNSITLQKRSANALTAESLLAAAGEFVLADASPEEDTYTGPVEQEDLTVRGDSFSLAIPSFAESQAKLNRVPGGTTVIDGERIQEGAPLSANDIFATAPGVYVGEYSAGAAGGLRISIRGSDSNSIISPIRGLKILRNGMPITSANGSSTTEAINFYALDHVEVYRGANALEYGGSNLGGAINLITPTGYTAEGVRVGMKWGTYDYVNPTVSFGKAFDNGFDVYGSFSYLSTDTTRKNNKQEQVFGHGNIGYRWNENHETRLYFDIQNHNFLGLDPLTKQQIEEDPQQNDTPWALPNGMPVYRADLKHTVLLDDGDRFDVGAYYMYQDFDFAWTGRHPRDVWQDTGFNWRHIINGDLMGMQNRVVWGSLMQWMFIDDYNYATVNRSRGPLEEQERDEWRNVEAYLEDQLSLTDTFTLIAGVQLNYRSVKYERTFGFVPSAARPYNQVDKDFFIANPKLGFTWQASDEIQLYGNLSRSSEPPPLADLRHVFLSPPRELQTASTIEIGTRGHSDFLQWDFAFYHAWVNNEYLIVRDPVDRTAFNVTNANSTTLHTGIELGLESHLPLNLAASGDEIRFTGNYTWNHFRFDNDPGLGDNHIPGIPQHVARMEALYKHPSGFYAGPNAQIVSSNWVDYTNTLSARPYALLGARIGWDDGKHWKIFVDGRNLTDEHYASSVWVRGDSGGADTASFNPGATRTVIGGIEYRF